MKSIKAILMGAVCLSAIACGDARLTPTDKGSTGTPATIPNPMPILKGTRADLRLQGDNAGGQSVWLTVSDAEITANGAPLALHGQWRSTFDLGQTDQGWYLGSFIVPEGIDKVHVTLRFDDWGAYQGPTAAGYFDARAPAIEFDAPVSSLSLRGHAVVHVDLQDSLRLSGAEEGRLVPTVRVLY